MVVCLCVLRWREWIRRCGLFLQKNISSSLRSGSLFPSSKTCWVKTTRPTVSSEVQSRTTPGTGEKEEEGISTCHRSLKWCAPRFVSIIVVSCAISLQIALHWSTITLKPLPCFLQPHSVNLNSLPFHGEAVVAPRCFHFTITALTIVWGRSSWGINFTNWLGTKVPRDSATFKVTELFRTTRSTASAWFYPPASNGYGRNTRTQ